MRFKEFVKSAVPNLFPDLFYRGVWQYRIAKVNIGNIELGTGIPTTLDLQPVEAKWLPDLLRVPIWPGVSGYGTRPADGSDVLVAFVDAHPTKPIVVAFIGIGGVQSIPIAQRWEASLLLRFFETSSGRLRVGPELPSPPVPVALSPGVQAAFAAASAALTAIDAFGIAVGVYVAAVALVVPVTAPAAGDFAPAVAALSAAIASANAAIAAQAAPYPAGYAATRTEST